MDPDPENFGKQINATFTPRSRSRFKLDLFKMYGRFLLTIYKVALRNHCLAAAVSPSIRLALPNLRKIWIVTYATVFIRNTEVCTGKTCPTYVIYFLGSQTQQTLVIEKVKIVKELEEEILVTEKNQKIRDAPKQPKKPLNNKTS